MLACQLIKVTRLPIQLINILRTRSHGAPLYAEQLVSTMLQFKVLQVSTDYHVGAGEEKMLSLPSFEVFSLILSNDIDY